MDNQKHWQAWEKFLDPAVMQDRLISTSLFIAAFESLKSSIIDRVKQFYQVGYGIGGDTLDPEYLTEVTSRNSSPLYASIDWLKEHGAIVEADIASFDEVKTFRNKLAHSLLKMIADDDLAELHPRFEDLIGLLRKVEVWWVVNVEIPCNPDFDGDTEIDEDGIVPGAVWSMQMMMEVATGKTDYLTAYRKQSENNKKANKSEQATPRKPSD